MKFCSFCDNMMYINLTDDVKMQYYCKNCDNKDECDTSQSICVIDNNYIDDETNYKQYLNKHIKHDKTLPRVTNIKCANKKCKRRNDNNNEIIVIKYDFTNMKYLYHCENCEHFWRLEKS